MSQPGQPLNPYAPTTATGAPAGVDPDSRERATQRPKSLPLITLRWLGVCGLSAIPSFVFGLALTGGRVAGMITGILLFVLLYTYLDYRTANWPFRQKVTVRRTLRIAYGTRIAISVLFPLGMYVDAFCGILSVSITQTIMAQQFTASDSMGFAGALFTTLVQGVVLNIVLAFYALLVHAIQLTVIAIRH